MVCATLFYSRTKYKEQLLHNNPQPKIYNRCLDVCTCLLRHISERTRTCPGRMREINLRDQSHASRSWGPEISRFGVDYVRLSIWIQNLWDDKDK